MNLKLFTLNLWRYYDYNVRLKNIVQVIKASQPDVIFLQEAQLDKTKSAISQPEELQNLLANYPFMTFSVIYLKTTQRGEKLEFPVQHGMAILSRHPIVKAFDYYVRLQAEEPEPRMVQCVDINVSGTIHKLANVHFANNEDWAKEHLREFLEFMALRGERRIMAGDFNMFKLSQYSDITKGYTNSLDFAKYISYPKDKGTLDYVLLPKDDYIFSRVATLDDYLSDHRAVLAQIEQG